MEHLINETIRNNLYDYLQKYIDTHCIHRVPDGQPMLLGKAPGTRYTWQFYLRKGLFNPEFNEAMSILMLDKIYSEIGHFDFQLAGLETASTPMLAVIPLIAMRYGITLTAFSIRKERKTYGLLNWTEGRIDFTKPVLLVDDLSNSQNTMYTAAQIVLKECKLNVLPYTLTIVNKKNDASNDHLLKDFKSLHLFTTADFGLIY